MLREPLIYLSRSRAARAVVTQTPLKAMAERFVPGERVEDLVGAVREANGMGFGAIANYLGESVHDEANARKAADVYLRVLEALREHRIESSISVKFTQLGQDISERVLGRNLRPLLERANEVGSFVRFDMEDSTYTQRTLDAFETLWNEGWRDIGVVLQSYLRRSVGDVARMNELGAQVRLCKGAYAEPPEVAFQDKAEVDRSFVELTRMLLAEGNYPAIATHDERMIEATIDFQQREGVSKDAFEFQMLHGVRRDLQKELVEDGYRMKVYIPFGEHWYPYLMRRLAERPANMLFFAGSVIQESPLGFLWPKGPARGNGAGG
jgi:proline dehydrogenase